MFYVNDVPVKPTIFPDQTSQIWKLPEEIQKAGSYVIKWEFDNEAEVIRLGQLVNLLDSFGSEYIDLYLKYLPYGRQDKNVSNEATFGLHSFAQFINSFDFRFVTIMDPHSMIALELIARSIAVFPLDVITKVLIQTNNGVVCYPDKGAVTKYSEKYPYVYVYGEKVREQSTGKILKYELVANKMGVSGQNVLIIDDICDGGATFILLAKELYAAGANEVSLFVTHGIFSRGLKPLFESSIKRIFTQDGEASEINNGPTGPQICYRRL